jgi:hypothetical protein
MIYQKYDNRICNLILMKIRNNKFNEICQYVKETQVNKNVLTDLEIQILLLQMELPKKKKDLLVTRRDNLYKNRYISKLKKYNNMPDIIYIRRTLKNMFVDEIRLFNKYYDNFVNFFMELDTFVSKEYENHFLFNEESDKLLGLDNLMGLGLVIRNEYIFAKNNDDINTIFLMI